MFEVGEDGGRSHTYDNIVFFFLFLLLGRIFAFFSVTLYSKKFQLFIYLLVIIYNYFLGQMYYLYYFLQNINYINKNLIKFQTSGKKGVLTYIEIS